MVVVVVVHVLLVVVSGLRNLSKFRGSFTGRILVFFLFLFLFFLFFFCFCISLNVTLLRIFGRSPRAILVRYTKLFEPRIF